MATGRFGAQIILEDMAKESIAIVGVGLFLLIGRYSFRLPEHLEWGV